MELDQLSLWQHQLIALEAILGIPVGPLPLLADHLDLKRAGCVGWHRDLQWIRPLATSSPMLAGEQLPAPPASQEEDDRAGGCDPSHYHSPVALERRTILQGRSPMAEANQAVGEVDDE